MKLNMDPVNCQLNQDLMDEIKSPNNSIDSGCVSTLNKNNHPMEKVPEKSPSTLNYNLMEKIKSLKTKQENRMKTIKNREKTRRMEGAKILQSRIKLKDKKVHQNLHIPSIDRKKQFLPPPLECPEVKKLEEPTSTQLWSPSRGRPSVKNLERILESSPDLKVTNLLSLLQVLQDVYVIEHGNWVSDAVATFNNSLKFCDKNHLNKFTFKSLPLSSNNNLFSFKCQMSFDENLIIEGVGNGRSIGSGQFNAQLNVVKKALQLFKQLCPTVEIKQQPVVRKRKVTRADLLKTLFLPCHTPVQSDKAMSMLSKMGWSGGGLGVKGTGISEPIDVVSKGINRNRIGLGHHKLTEGDQIKEFSDRVRKFLMDESAGQFNSVELEFSNEFSTVEKRIINSQAATLRCYIYKNEGGLKGRHNFKKRLILCRKFDLGILIKKLISREKTSPGILVKGDQFEIKWPIFKI